MRVISRKFKKGKATAYCENNSFKISFNTCFEYESKVKLPKQFQYRDERIFVRNKHFKLNKFDNTLYKVKTDGTLKFKDLEDFLPSVFDIKVIKTANSNQYVLENINHIMQISQDVLGIEETTRIFKNRKI